jgi:hypothetical protein
MYTTADVDRARELADARLIDDSFIEYTDQDAADALEAAQEVADLLSLDQMSRDWCLFSLIESMPADDRALVMRSLANQVARQIAAGDGL